MLDFKRVVCARLGVPLEDPDYWILKAAMETGKTWGAWLSLDQWREAVARAEATDPRVEELACAVLALGDAP